MDAVFLHLCSLAVGLALIVVAVRYPAAPVRVTRNVCVNEWSPLLVGGPGGRPVLAP